MAPTHNDRTNMSRALRDVFLETPESELRDVLAEAGMDFDALAARGRAVGLRALAGTREDTGQVEDLHRGLGALVRLLRRRDNLTLEQLAAAARVDPSELRSIESNPSFDPNPRTIFQIEQFFRLPARSLVVLSGAVRVESEIREEVLRFAASSKDISKLSREEKKLLAQFVQFLSEHTDG